jgi:hypothetical protein
MAMFGRSVATPEEAEKRIADGTSWNDFCDTLKLAGSVILRDSSPSDPLSRAEGFRYLSRILRAGLEAFVEHADARAPVLARMVHETVKMGADNPDNYYQNASISGAYEYRIIGTRGTVPYLSFATQSGGYGEGLGLPLTGFLDAKDLVVAPDGTFEIAVSVEPRPGNWLPMKPESGTLIVRQTFARRSSETIADLRVERVGGDRTPAPLTAQAVDRGLGRASGLVGGVAALFANWAEGFRQHENQLPEFDAAVSKAFGGDPNIVYYHGYWRLGPDEALIIDATPPDCELWNFQLNNHWMESLDYRHHRIWVNKHTARYRDDGSVRIIVAHRDPGGDNWIDTVGHNFGTMLFRWIRATSHPQPRTRVIKLDELVGGGGI